MPTVIDAARRRPNNADLPPKNRVWGFRVPARQRIRESVKQVAEPHQENGATGTTSVSGVVDWYINDHLGTPQKLVDEGGAVVWTADYAAFGKATVTTGTVENNLRFPGQYYDAETGLHYNWHRTYDPQLGRYLSNDPIGIRGGDLNLYVYVMNNSPSHFDYNGLYGSNVHYDMTHDLALDVGIDPGTARRIAEGNQGLDEGFFDYPGNPFNWIIGNMRLHFLEKNDAENLLRKCEDSGFSDIDEFGRMLHAMQDSYSHKGYGFPFGHIMDDPWNKTDKYNPTYNIRDWTMRENTRSWLEQFKESRTYYYRSIK